MGSDPILESSQCKRLGSTVASKSHNGHGRTTKEKLEPDPSNQVGPAYAYKVDHDHGAAGSHGPRCPWSVPFIAKTAVRHRAVMHKVTTSGPQLFRRATTVIRDHKGQREPDPSNQVGPEYASKVHHDHGAGGRFWRYTSYIKIQVFLRFLLQTVTTFYPERSLKGDRFDQTFDANYINATIGLCNLHLLCKRGPKLRLFQGGRTRLTCNNLKGSTYAGPTCTKSAAPR